MHQAILVRWFSIIFIDLHFDDLMAFAATIVVGPYIMSVGLTVAIVGDGRRLRGEVESWGDVRNPSYFPPLKPDSKVTCQKFIKSALHKQDMQLLSAVVASSS